MADTALPRHVGFIIDGNRRWAKMHGLPKYEGYLAGYNTIKEVSMEAFYRGAEFVSVYLFSTENWRRAEEEVNMVMGLAVKMLTTDIGIFHDNQIRLVMAGSRSGVPEAVLKAIDNAVEATRHYKKGTFVICFNYGGHLEIADACKKIVQAGIAADDITAEVVAEHLYVPEVPALDLIVRTSGEQRLSNFMLWRSAYSELMFIDKLWPDMTKDDISSIIEEYSRRDRRIGG